MAEPLHFPFACWVLGDYNYLAKGTMRLTAKRRLGTAAGAVPARPPYSRAVSQPSSRWRRRSRLSRRPRARSRWARSSAASPSPPTTATRTSRRSCCAGSSTPRRRRRSSAPCAPRWAASSRYRLRAARLWREGTPVGGAPPHRDQYPFPRCGSGCSRGRGCCRGVKPVALSSGWSLWLRPFPRMPCWAPGVVEASPQKQASALWG